MADGIERLGATLGAIGADLTNTQQTQSITKDPGPTQFMFGSYGIKAINTRLLIEWQNVGNAFILGSSTNGVLGTNVLGSLNMIWGNTGSVWGVVSWGGTLPAYSTLYDNVTSQDTTIASKNSIAAWFAGTAVNKPNYVALGIGKAYYEPFTGTTYKDAGNTTATGWV